MIDLWEMRNEEVHGKEEATIQQKRKAKAAITVRALHKLEKQARPCDSNLFYQDVEATIKLVSAATLEGFIAMKNRAINNNVREWAKRSTGRVKLIVDWIRKGGKNNKETIDRIEKRLRDHFRHKAHKNQRRKRKEGTVQYIPQ